METSKKSHHVLPLRSLNHVSRVCNDVRESATFYRDVLGFVEVKRPSAFEFEGSWLFGYSIGIHLIKGKPQPRAAVINPKADHLSFQSDSLPEVEKRLKQSGIEYIKDTVLEDGVRVTQIFFHDPENNMIEICNCDCLPVEPLCDQTSICAIRSMRSPRQDANMRSPRQDISIAAYGNKAPAAYYAKGPGMLTKESFAESVAISQSARG